MSIPSSRCYRRSPELATREIARETILVPIRGEVANLQQIFVLNPVAAFIWERLDGSRSLAELERGIVETFEVEAQEATRDLMEFVTALEAAGLIVDADIASEQEAER